MKTFYKKGDIIDYTNAGSAIASGDVVVIGTLVGIAMNDIAASTGVGSVLVSGIVKVTKVGSQAWTQGQAVYWNPAGTFTTAVASGYKRAGCAALAVGSGSGETTGYVCLNAVPGIGTLAAATSLTQAALTDSTGGSAAATLAAATATYSATVVNGNFASISDRIDQIKVDVAAILAAIKG